MSAGDYVVIQFAHNDEKNGGMDGTELKSYYTSTGQDSLANVTDYRGTNPSTTYKEYLRKYVTETREAGCTPILCGPICRMYFSGNTIRRNGRHDLGDSFSKLTDTGVLTGQKVDATDHTMDYVYQMQQVAEEMDVPFIDLTTATADLYLSYGDTQCHSLLGDGAGSTHLSATGAALIARRFAALCQEVGVMSEYIQLSSELSVSPVEGDMGQGYQGQTLTKEFMLSGFDLNPTSGTVTLTADGDVELSTDQTTWGTTATMAYAGGTLVERFYARMELKQAGANTATIQIAAGDKTATIPVTATGVVLTGGTEVDAYWRLESDAECVLTGPATVVPESWHGMELQRYSNPNANTVWPDWTGYEASRKTQRNVIEGNTWPAGEIDEVSTRYIEFGITAMPDTRLDIDEISGFLCGCGGNGMCVHAYYSINDDFSDQHLLYSAEKLPANNMQYVKVVPVLSLEGGQTLRVRFYPWYNAEASGKTLCLSDIHIHGYSTSTAEAETPVAQEATLTWPIDKGTSSATQAESAAADLFSIAEFSYGSNLTIQGTRTDGNAISATTFQPIEGSNANNDDANALIFTVKPKKGITFQPTHLSFQASRVGTNGGNIAVGVTVGGEETLVENSFTPQLVKEAPYFSLCDYDLSSLAATDEPLYVKIYIRGIANNKQYAFQNVTLTGTTSGQVIAVPSYSFATALGTEGAGTIAATPAGTTFDEGTKITVTASENFGYHFIGWTDAAGQTVSTENPYTFELTQDLALTAQYSKTDVYALHLTIEGGANDNQVLYTPEGNVVDGVHYYEAGTDVQLTAVNNRILTFTNWDDNSTNLTREVKMSEEKSVTAHFSAADYIVGWDFYYDQPNSERAADYKDESDNAGLLSLRDSVGNTSTWLTRGISNGAENGKYGARIWRLRSAGYYFELSFSSVGYTNLVLSAALGISYNSYSTINAQYSVDGETYTTFGTYTLASGWTSNEFALPTEAANQQRVRIRFMPDRTSALVGVSSDYDGLCIAELYVLADKEAGDDATAPQLLSSVPAAGADDASTTGAIILNFDEKIRLGSGDATLSGEVLTPTVSGKSVVYSYAGLDYGQTYTFTLPAGAITDRSGNAYAGTTLTFTTLQRAQPEARLYDAVVDQSGKGDYLTLQAAIDAAPTDRVKPWLIFVKNGNYKEHIDIPANKPYLHIIGQDRDKTVILDDQLCGGENAVHVSVGATVVVRSNDCLFENIALENSYGHEQQNGPQALALNTMGDRTIFNNVAMLSYQDTWITPSTSNYRAYVRNSFIEGAVDFIYNSGNIYIDNTTLYITRSSGGFIVAPSHGSDVEWGYVFNRCTITAPGDPSKTSVWLGRPWHNYPKTVFLNTRAEVTIPATGWYETMGGLPAIWADWNTTDAQGNLLDLSQRRDTYYYTDSDGNKVYGKAKNSLTDEEAAQYTLKNVLSGSDAWQPLIKTEECAAPTVSLAEGKLSWEAVPYAICYVVTCGDEVVDITTACSLDVPADATAIYAVQAVNEYGGLSAKGLSSSVSSIEGIVEQSAAPRVRRIYNAQGVSQSALRSGVNLIYEQDAQGRVTTRKEIH
jgi:pectin methylesterase-like acyl-CoA thioesterase